MVKKFDFERIDVLPDAHDETRRRGRRELSPLR
jgi:hypothetical protein